MIEINMAEDLIMEFGTCSVRSKLSDECIEDMGIRLNEPVGHGVSTLGKELNMSQSEMSQIYSSPNPGKCLIKTWSNKPDTTIQVLYSVLTRIRRQDVLDLLYRDLKDEYELDIYVTFADTNTAKPLTVTVQGKDVMSEVLKKIPDFRDIQQDRIKCTMEARIENFFECPASTFKGRHVRLVVLSEQHGRTVWSEPSFGNFRTTNRKGVVSLTPIQETGDDMNLWKNAGVSSQLRRGSAPKIPLKSHRVSADSGIDEHLNRLSVESNQSDDNSSCTDPTTSSQDSHRSLSFKLYPDSYETIPSDLPDYGDSDYLTPPGQGTADRLDGFHPEGNTIEEIERILLPYIAKNNTYIIRPSRENTGMNCISVVYKKMIESYRIQVCLIHHNSAIKSRYYLYENDKFDTLEELIQYYSQHPMSSSSDTNGPMLKYPA